MLLRKKRGAPHSCFCVPHPQKNVFAGVHVAKAGVDVRRGRKERESRSQGGSFFCRGWTKWQKVDNLAQKMDIMAGMGLLARNLPQ